MSKNMFVTGVAGFIGRHVAAEAVRRGYRVSGVDRVPASAPHVAFTQADIRDRDRMARLLEGQDHVVHLAAVTSNVEFSKSPAECYDINVNGFLSVLDAAARGGCKKLAYASSAAVYLDQFSEDVVLDPRKQRNHYAKSKIINEMMADSYQDISAVRLIGLRYFNVYGQGENTKGDYASIITIFRTMKAKGEPLVVYGDGRQARDLINVRDAAQLTLDLLEKGESGVYNVGTGVATTYLKIAEMIDRGNIRFVPNPLSSYQYYTRAETARVRGTLGDYELLALEDGIKALTG